MFLINELKWHQVAKLMACTGLLSSCGGSNGGPIDSAASAHADLATHAYAYVATPSTVTTYSIDPSTGGLTASGSSPLTLSVAWPFGGITQIATDPSGRVLCLLHYSGVHAYTINRKTGALTEGAGSPSEAGVGPNSLAFDASGAHLYVAARTRPVAPVNTLISAYSVNPSGALVRLATYTVTGESSTLVTAGNHLYVAGFDTNSIAVFSIGPSGKLTQNVAGSPFATDTEPHSIAVDPSGSVLYTANDGTPTANEPAPGSISAFTINSSTGSLTPVAGNPLPIAVTGSISIDPKGKFLFIPEANGVSVYAINTATGALSAVAGSPFLAGTHPGPVSIDPANQTVYVLNGGSANVSEFTLSNTGVLAPLAGSPTPVGAHAGSMAIVWK